MIYLLFHPHRAHITPHAPHSTLTHFKQHTDHTSMISVMAQPSISHLWVLVRMNACTSQQQKEEALLASALYSDGYLQRAAPHSAQRWEQ